LEQLSEQVIRVDEDPTSSLRRIVARCREGRLMDLLGDLKRGGEMLEMTRWEFYAAPFSIELSEGPRERLAGAWKDRPPRPQPGESEPYPP
jgi:hypothetical protein